MSGRIALNVYIIGCLSCKTHQNSNNTFFQENFNESSDRNEGTGTGRNFVERKCGKNPAGKTEGKSCQATAACSHQVKKNLQTKAIKKFVEAVWMDCSR